MALREGCRISTDTSAEMDTTIRWLHSGWDRRNKYRYGRCSFGGDVCGARDKRDYGDGGRGVLIIAGDYSDGQA